VRAKQLRGEREGEAGENATVATRATETSNAS